MAIARFIGGHWAQLPLGPMVRGASLQVWNLQVCTVSLSHTGHIVTYYHYYAMYLSMMVTSCSGERSFSKLALIKNCLRTTMTNERLNALSILDVKNSVLNMTEFEAILNDFVESKCRQKEFFSRSLDA